MKSFGENVTESFGIKSSLESVITSTVLNNLGIESQQGVYFVSNAIPNEIGERIIRYLQLKESVINTVNESMSSDAANSVYYLSSSFKDIIRAKLIKFLRLEELINRILDEPIEIPIVVTNDKIKLPEYAKEGDVGMDVRSAESMIFLHPGEKVLINTGIKVALPQNFEFEVVPRSGLSLNLEFEVSNSPGTIDPRYKNPIGVIVKNGSTRNDGMFDLESKGNPQGTYIIKFGDRIAQIKLKRVSKCIWKPTSEEEFKTLGKDRGGGFGHTGTK